MTTETLRSNEADSHDAVSDAGSASGPRVWVWGRWSTRQLTLRTALELAILAVLLLLIAVELWVVQSASFIGGDFRTYRDAASNWLSTGAFYHPYQLSGPYRVWSDQIMYPPIILPLLLPFLWLPPVVWWLVPLGLTSAVVWSWRPSLGAWLVLLACLATPFAITEIAAGNPGLWVMATLAAGTRWGWPGALAMFKPSLAPLALVGITHRGWWLAAGAMALVSLAMLPLDFDYLRALHNVSEWPVGSPLYTLANIPLVVIPLIAWAGSTRVSPVQEFREKIGRARARFSAGG